MPLSRDEWMCSWKGVENAPVGVDDLHTALAHVQRVASAGSLSPAAAAQGYTHGSTVPVAPAEVAADVVMEVAGNLRLGGA